MAAVSPTPTIEVITSEPKASTDSKEDNAGDITTQFVGLEELNNTDKIVVQQMTGLVAAACCCGYEGENMFEISDRLGTYQDMVFFKKNHKSTNSNMYILRIAKLDFQVISL